MRIVLTLLTLIFVITFSSCEGRKTPRQALSESVKKFNKEITIQIDTYHPKTYMEQKVDTLLSNGYHVNISVYTDMNKSVVFSEIKDTINYNHHYRNFKFNILVEKEGKTIYNKPFNKDTVNKLFRYDAVTPSNTKDYNFDKLGILKSIEVDDNSPNSDTIKIEIMYAIPNTERLSLHILSINDNGSFNIKRIEAN